MPKHTKKGKTRLDKYYYLAKEQGYRSRAAFKLIQLNRKYNFLSKAKVLLDLCAAPGGWLQVASKEMSQSSVIIGLDLVPIKPIRNVRTFSAKEGGDITSAKCRKVLKAELNNWKVDVVLHDGAPNVGGAWAKDAYGQSELVLHSLKLATEFLRESGTFVTKVFRSSDYNALMWIFKHLFKNVTATKPQSSRSTSAEIFVVCQGYLAPDKIDPKFLDPAYVFKQYDEPKKNVDIFHKKAGKAKRNRGGYDESLGVGMHRSCDAMDFIAREDPTRVLSDYQSIKFGNASVASGVAEHPLTTEEVKACCADLQVLGQKDFKALLKWRTRISKWLKKVAERRAAAEADHPDDKDEEAAEDEVEDDPEARSKARRDKQLLEYLERKKRESRRELKRERNARAKMRKRLALGMEKSAVDDIEADVFSLANVRSESALNAVAGGDVPDEEDPTFFADDDEPRFPHGRPPSLRTAVEPERGPDMAEYDRDMAAQFEAEHADMQAKRRQRAKLAAAGPTGLAGGGKKGRRKRETMRLQELFDKEIAPDDAIKRNADEDSDSSDSGAEEERARRAYLKSIAGGGRRDSDDDSDDDSEGFDEDAEVAAAALLATGSDMTAASSKRRKHPLLKKFEDTMSASDLATSRTKKWFSAPIFDEIKADLEKELATIPKSDRELRRDKLRKVRGKEEKRASKQKKKDAAGFRIVAQNVSGQVGDDTNSGLTIVSSHEKSRDSFSSKNKRSDVDADGPKMTKAQVRRREAERLIKAGMGTALQMGYDIDSAAATVAEEEGRTVPEFVVPGSRADPNAKRVKRGDFEIVPSDVDLKRREALAALDDIEIGSKEHAEILAMGQLMFSHSRAKAMVDASYNRYTWHDDEDLPTWFADDQRKHNRPQLPVTRDVVNRIRKRFQDLAEKPIKKVAEARARKRKRTVEKMQKAKKKAQAILDAPDMSAYSKMKAVAKAYRGTEVKRPSKTYVVGQSKGTGKNSYSVKFVDKRLKSDRRGMKLKAKGKNASRRRGTKSRQKKRRKRR